MPGIGPKGNVTALTSSPAIIGSERGVHMHQEANQNCGESWGKQTDRARRERRKGGSNKRWLGGRKEGRREVVEKGRK